MKAITNDNLIQLQSFATTQLMDQSINEHFKQHGRDLTPTARKVLNLISTYSCKIPGVCYLAKSTMAEILDVDIRTIRRCCNQLTNLGIIVQHERKRLTGDRRQTSNAIVIQPVKTEACPPEMSDQKAIIKANLINNTNDTDKAEPTLEMDKESLIKKGLVTKLPATLQQVLAPFFNSDTLYKLSGIVFKAKASVDKTITLEDYETDYYKAILSVMNTFKRGKAYNLEGLLYSAIQKATQSIWIKQRALNAFGL